jgi:hypothetical protein
MFENSANYIINEIEEKEAKIEEEKGEEVKIVEEIKEAKIVEEIKEVKIVEEREEGVKEGEGEKEKIEEEKGEKAKIEQEKGEGEKEVEKEAKIVEEKGEKAKIEQEKGEEGEKEVEKEAKIVEEKGEKEEDFIIKLDHLKFGENICKINKRYHYVINAVKFFLLEKGLYEYFTGNELSIFSVCDPFNVKIYEYDKHKFPFIQSNQICLDEELLKNPTAPGFFCITNVYKKDCLSTYPIIEFVLNGNVEILEIVEKELLNYLEYQISNCVEKDYDYISKKKKKDVLYLSDDIKQKIYEKFGTVVFLKNYPEYANTHWNIKKNQNNTYNKITVILSGQEVIESYENDTDKNQIFETFTTMQNGTYNKKLYELFGEKYVNNTLNNYLSNTFITRSSGKIYINELIISMLQEGLIPEYYR